MQAYDDLMAHQRQTVALAQVAGRLGWDQETVMPPGAGPQRAEESAAMETVLHARRADPQIADWLAAAEAGMRDLDDVQRGNLREIRRSFDRATRVPGDLAAELARTTSIAQGIWSNARAKDDYSAFAPTLVRVIDLRQQEADALRTGKPISRYDALLDEYEPGATEATLTAMFDALRPRLVDLRTAIAESGVTFAPLEGRFDEATQLALTRDLALTFGYDLDFGRIDKAVHPFSSGSGLDVRITTRTDEADPFNAIYSTVHEVGHAAYEQGIDRAHLLSPVGQGASMGVHESQSRIYENQIARSEAFTAYLYDRMTALFGKLSTPDALSFYGAVNRVTPGFIRTEADEVHYNLHILMRFDLERALLSGDLTAADLPGAWNDRFLADFGQVVDRPSHGCLQDVHWSLGMFGYFPTYTLGNVYAGCLHQAMKADLPALAGDLRGGDTGPATRWLRERLQQFGAVHAPAETIRRATGAEPAVEPLLTYLEEKFGALYRL